MSMAAKIPDPEEQAAEAAKYGYFDHEKMVLTRNGVWLADGEEITHEPTRRLFAKSLQHDSKGYFLYIGHETKRIQVEDTAYFVHRIERHGNQIELWVSDDSQEPLDLTTLAYSPGRLTCKIKQGREEAKFLSAPYHELLKDLDEDESGYFLRHGSGRVVLAKK
jgi:hypothetical protein